VCPLRCVEGIEGGHFNEVHWVSDSVERGSGDRGRKCI
jgi:hypothetical protein